MPRSRVTLGKRWTWPRRPGLSEPVHEFLQHVEESHLIYTERMGDLLWHSAALQLFAKQPLKLV